MNRTLLALPLLLLGCAESEPEIAYLIERIDMASFLDDTAPARTWTVHLESDELARRQGMTWSTMRVETTLIVPDSDPWQDTSVKAWLTGDGTIEDAVQFSSPGADGLSLFDELESDCVQGEPCTWDWDFGIERLSGYSQVGLEIVFQGVISLGDAEQADPFAELDLIVEENPVEPKDTGLR